MEIDWHETERGLFVSVITELGERVARRAAQLALKRTAVYVSTVFLLDDGRNYYLWRRK